MCSGCATSACATRSLGASCGTTRCSCISTISLVLRLCMGVRAAVGGAASGLQGGADRNRKVGAVSVR